MNARGRRIGISCILLGLLGLLALAGTAAGDDAPIELSLEKCVGIAVKSATQVLEQQNQVILSAAEVLASYGQFLPNLVVSGGYGYQTGKTLYTIDGDTLVDSRAQNANVNLSSTLNLFNGLADYSGLRSALARRRAREQSLSWAKQQVALDITQTYLQLIFDRQLLEIARKNVTASDARLKLLQGQSDVGSASVPDLLRQRAETSADTFALVSYESRVDDDRLLLIRKLRVDASRAYSFTEPNLEPESFPLAQHPVSELVAEALTARQDVAAARSQVDSTEWGVTGARSGYLPRLDLVFGRSAAGTLLSRDIVNGSDALTFPQQSLGAQLGNQVEYSIGLNLSWSVFDRFVTHYNSEQAGVALSNARIGLEDSTLQVETDVRTAITGWGSALKQLEAARTGVTAAEKSFQAVDGNYRVGSASIVDVLTAQASLVQARSNQAQALTNLKLQRSALEYALGDLPIND